MALRFTDLLILFGIRRNCLRSGRSPSLYLFTRRVVRQVTVNVNPYHFCQLHTKFNPISCGQCLVHMQRK